MYDHEKSAGRSADYQPGFAGVDASRAGVPGSSPAQDPLSVLMDKMAGVLESQTVYRREIASLQREVAELENRLAEREREHAERVRALEAEAGRLRSENRRMEDYVRRRVERGGGLHATPSSEFMMLPLVIGTDRGEFLGVGGKGRGHFTVRNLLSLIQSSQSAARSVKTDWDRDRDHWILHVRVRDARQQQHLVLLLRRTLTPSSNLVAQLASMVVDGKPVPDPFLLGLFRQIKDSFND